MRGTTDISATPFTILNPFNSHICNMTSHYKQHHSLSGRVSGWKYGDRYIIDMTDWCGVGHWAVSATDRIALTAATHMGGVIQLNTVDNINKVRGASLFPSGQFVCNELQAVRLWGDMRSYKVQASGRILMYLEGYVSHLKPLSIQTGIIRSTTTARF